MQDGSNDEKTTQDDGDLGPLLPPYCSEPPQPPRDPDLEGRVSKDTIDWLTRSD